MSSKLLFIHGYGSCGSGIKADILREHFGANRLLAPDLSHVPDIAIGQLQTILDEQPVSGLIGSSLGGFYATWLNSRQPLPAVLINPAVAAHEILAPHLGPFTNWCNGEPFELQAAHIDQLRELYRPRLNGDERYLVLLQSGDEVLDYRQAADYYREHQVVIEPGGDHRFDNLADYLPLIDQFLQASR